MSSDKRLGGFWLESYAIIMMRDVSEMTGAGIGLGQSDLKGTNVYAGSLRVKGTFRNQMVPVLRESAKMRTGFSLAQRARMTM